MSVLLAEVYEAPKASVTLNGALARVEDETSKGFSKRDADIDSIRKDVQALKVDGAVLKSMIGFNLASSIAILFKIFSH
ncbi:MAG: hypothetical protein ACRYGP_00705 [Janthinobacterium lividum]